MHFVSGHKRPAGRGSVLDGVVWRGAVVKMKIQLQRSSESTIGDGRLTGCSHCRLIFAIFGCATAEEELWLALSFVVHGIFALYTSKECHVGSKKRSKTQRQMKGEER